MSWLGVSFRFGAERGFVLRVEWLSVTSIDTNAGHASPPSGDGAGVHGGGSDGAAGGATTGGGGPGYVPPNRRRRWLLLGIPLVVAALVAGALLVRGPASSPERIELPAVIGMQPSEERARQQLGEPPSKQPWFSGAWAAGNTASTSRIDAFGAWRGTPVDAATVYPDAATWQSIYDSDWHVNTYAGFQGVLAYGLPLLPDETGSDFASVISGEHDWVYEKVASDLVAGGRGNSIVRIGWEANGDWFPWNAKASNAAEYVAAYRHVVGVLRATAPDLVIDFDLGCGTKLRGQENRLDALNLLYPGDDVVDLVGCDFYDWHNTRSTDEASWQQTIRPTNSVGIADVADFARAHGKGLTYPEWGVASTELEGAGDNPFFIGKVREFFEANADVLVLESYFSEPETSLANSIYDPIQMPLSAEVYQRLW